MRLDVEESFPAPRDKLWDLLWMHLDEATIKEIHPEIMSDKTVSFEGPRDRSVPGDRRWVVDRTIKYRGKTYRMTWEYSISPPERLRFDIIESDGLVTKGSYVDSIYAEAPEGTRISTRAEITLEGVPRFLQKWGARRLLNVIDKGDIDYFRKIGLQSS